jgi:hydrophobe/amphiphile efflux-1 (HAE1) family protein
LQRFWETKLASRRKTATNLSRVMNFSETFIRRPVATVLLTAGIILLGAIAYFRLPIAALPILERPIIAVRAGLPGGSSSTIAAAVTAPLEKQLGLISGLREMASTSIYGRSGIVMEFNLNKNIDDAAGEVQAAIFAAGPSLPPTVQGPPIYVEANPNGFPIFAIGLTSDVYSIPEIYRFADRVLVGKLSQIQGVAKVFLSGSRKPAIRVQVNPRELAIMKASTAQVRMALENSTLSMPLGEITEGSSTFTLATNDQLLTAADFADIVIKWNKDGPVKLKDVAAVFDSTVNDERAGWFDSDRAVVLSVVKTTNANVVETVEQIKKLLPQLRYWLPSSIHMNPLYDRTQLIRAAIADVKLTIAVAVALVIMVIAIFLRRFWATVIPTVTIPVSLAMTFGAMYLLGFSLNNISLMAVTIAVGFVIDDAIIMIENITRLIMSGETPLEAALKGTRQMGFTIISITTALIAALIPVFFMPDIPGRLFREFGLTLVVAIIASALVSLTLTPMLCGQLLREPKVRTEGRLSRSCAGVIECCVTWYTQSLDWSLRFRWLALTCAAALAAGSLYLYSNAPKAFLPTQDTGILRVRTISRSNIAFEAKRDSQQAIAQIILADPAVADLTSSIGKGKMSGGVMLIALKPRGIRKESVDEVIARLRRTTAKVQEARAIIVPVQDVTLGAKKGAARYQYAVSGLDPEQVARWGLVMVRKIRALPQVTDVVANYPKGGLGNNLITNRVRAARAGITVADIDSILYDWFGQEPLALIRHPSDFSRVVMEVEPEFRRQPSDLSNMFLTSGLPGDIVSMRKRDHAPLWNSHTDGIPSLTISFNTPIGVSISEAQAAIKAAERDAHLPSEIRTEWRGEARAAQEAREAQPFLFLAAIVAVYIILGMLYESYAHPLTILSTLPSASFGALLALAVTHTQFTLITAIACILVIGVVMKNAIMMVDFALEGERRMGLTAAQAIRRAAALRCRPIVMTTLAALLSALPLALGTGLDSELRQPLGIAIVGGLFISQFVTLYTTPAVYLAIDAFRSRRADAQAIGAASARHDVLKEAT